MIDNFIFKLKYGSIPIFGYLIYIIYCLFGQKEEFLKRVVDASIQNIANDFLEDEEFLKMNEDVVLASLFSFSMLYCHALYYIREEYETALLAVYKECVRKYRWKSNF